jgi:hypothetical protein
VQQFETNVVGRFLVRYYPEVTQLSFGIIGSHSHACRPFILLLKYACVQIVFVLKYACITSTNKGP